MRKYYLQEEKNPNKIHSNDSLGENNILFGDVNKMAANGNLQTGDRNKMATIRKTEKVNESVIATNGIITVDEFGTRYVDSSQKTSSRKCIWIVGEKMDLTLFTIALIVNIIVLTIFFFE